MKIRNSFRYFIYTLFMIVFTCGCGIGSDTSQNPLEGTSWDLLYYRKSSPIPGTKINITFEDGAIQGSAGCNSFGGSYQVDGHSLSIGEIYATEMYCMDPEGIMEQESFYLDFLRTTVRFQLDGDLLVLHQPGQETLTFERKN